MEIMFDSAVQELKYKVLREVARQEFNGTLMENILDIPKIIIPGKVPMFRCCVYKERAILAERVKIAMGGDKNNPNVIEVIDIACDECPAAGYEVTDSCRGCLAHRCEKACRMGAITFGADRSAHIDKRKCVECGMCSKACQFNAIINRKRPCQSACKIKAISINEEGTAAIDNNKCISCGACVHQCPFGAITQKSFILDVVRMIKNKGDGKVIAVVAPSIVGQLRYAKLGQIVSAIKEVGFDDVVEVALGADMVAEDESRELAEKGFLTSSCCPAFVQYIKTAFPDMVPYISGNLSPMAIIGKYLKAKDPRTKVVFIGPCTAKKMEMQLPHVKPYIDSVITFEELQALMDSREIDYAHLPETPLAGASYYGRKFAVSGGVAAAVAEAIKEQGIENFTLVPLSCDGIEACRTALMRRKKGLLDANFIEGMACTGGCVGGAGCLRHAERDKTAVELYSKNAGDQTILGAVAAAAER